MTVEDFFPPSFLLLLLSSPLFSSSSPSPLFAILNEDLWPVKGSCFFRGKDNCHIISMTEPKKRSRFAAIFDEDPTGNGASPDKKQKL